MPATAEKIESFTAAENAIIVAARQYFWYFLEHVYLRSFDGQYYIDDDGVFQPFSLGSLHREWAMMAQYNPRMCVIAPRIHLKTTVLAQGFAFWQMFRVDPGQRKEIYYISYKAELASEKVEDLKRFISANPFCRFWQDLKPTATTQINYVVNYGEGPIGEVDMDSGGILGAMRGKHPHTTICDDILSDFANPLSPQEILKINRVFRQAVMSLPPNPTDPLMVVGTPQSYDDILNLLAGLDDWLWLHYPAIVDEKNQVVQWPEKFSFARLKRIQREIGPTAFEVEFQLTPVQVTDQFFTREDILNVIDERLLMWPVDQLFDKGDLGTYGGFDIGKHVHPSHVSVLLQLPSGTLVQVYSQFLDQMRYNLQVKALNQIADTFRLSRGYFDATYNVLEDRGLRTAWRGRTFTRKLKGDMATSFEKMVVAEEDDPGIILLNDLRQLRQIITVDKALKAATTIDGHGDAFWSNGLAVKAAEDGPGIVDIGAPPPELSRFGLESSRAGQTWLRQLGTRI